ncbi:MAG: MFS transporter [Alphaproteobacteria bacterium]|nr:MFS transporter [Alphaproteobacteria bacterium]
MDLKKFLLNKITPKELSESEVKSSLNWVLQDGIFAQLFESLIAGPILIAVALMMGASNALIGYLVALPFLANIFQFLGIFLVEKYRNRRAICLFVSSLGRFCILGVAILALTPNAPMAAVILAVCYTFRYIGNALAGSAWNSWMKDLIPSKILGSFFAKRLGYNMATALIASLSIALCLKIWPWKTNTFYALTFFIAFLAGAYMMLVYYKIGEPPMEKNPSPDSFLKRIFKVFKDTNFSRLIMFLGTWNFAINLAVPFFTVVLLESLHLEMSFVLILTTLTQVVNVLVMRSWGKVSDTFNNKSILLICAPLYVLCIFLFLFTGFPQRHPYTIPLLVFIYALMGVAQAGVTLASNNIALKLAPKGNATIYLSVNSMVNALMAGTAPILGGMFADYFKDKKLSLLFRWFDGQKTEELNLLLISHWDFFFLLATIVALLSLSFLSKIKEEGQVNERVVISSFLTLCYENLPTPHKLYVFLSRKKYKEKLAAQKEQTLIIEQTQAN